MYNWDSPLRRMCVCGYVVHIWQLNNISVVPFSCLVLLLEWLPIPHQFPGAGLIDLLVLFVERDTSITTSQRSRAGSPSIRSPASNEITSDSVELWDTDVCFLHIQLMGTNVRLPKIHKTPSELDFDSSRSQTKSESWNKPSRQCWAVLPTWQYCR